MVLLLAGCIWGQYFELGWDEEVALHDGRVIRMHVTHTYERTRGWRRYDGAIHRDCELRFDAGAGQGTVTQLFMGFSPMLLDQHEGVWYAVLYGGYRKRSREIPGQDWGDYEGPHGQLAIRLDAGRWRPISMRALPEEFQKPNVMLLSGSVGEHADWDGTRVTLRQKGRWLKKYPPDPGRMQIDRPAGKRPVQDGAARE